MRKMEKLIGLLRYLGILSQIPLGSSGGDLTSYVY